MKKGYKRPTMAVVPVRMHNPLLAVSNESNFKSTISGYETSDGDDNGFSQISGYETSDGDDDGFSQE